MNRFLYYFIIVLVAISCEKFESQQQLRHIIADTMTKAGIEDYNVSILEANELANKLADGKHIIAVKAYTKEEDTLFYVVNYETGWKVISGDKRTQAILAEANSKSIDLQTIKNPGLKIWFYDLADHLKAIKNKPMDEIDESNILVWRAISENIKKQPVQTRYFDPTDTSEIGNGYRWVRIYQGTTSTDTYIDTIPKLLSTKWGQRAPWNNGYPYSPYNPALLAPTGCTAVAMSQVIYQSHYRLGTPSWLRHGSTVTGPINNYQYEPGIVVNNSTRWDDMPLDYNGIHTDYVGSLMADAGDASNMIYTLSESLAFPSVSAFNEFDLSCSALNSLSVSDVNASLQLGSPVIITAYASKISLPFGNYVYDDGHTWVIDGKTTRKRDIVDTYEWVLISHLPNFPSFNEPGWTYYTEAEAMAHDPDLYSGKIENVLTTVYTDFWRMNWGYDGEDDEEYYYPYSDWTVGGYTFKYNKKIWYNFVAL